MLVSPSEFSVLTIFTRKVVSNFISQGIILEKPFFKLGCEYSDIFWENSYTGVFGCAESESDWRYLIWGHFDLISRGQRSKHQCQGQTSRHSNNLCTFCLRGIMTSWIEYWGHNFAEIYFWYQYRKLKVKTCISMSNPLKMATYRA